MQRHLSRGLRRATVQDTIAVLGLAVIFYLMLASVVASKEPDWPLFWFALALLACGIIFYDRCARAILDLMDDLQAARNLEDIGRGAD